MADLFEGQTIPLSVEFKNPGGDLADPTTITLRVKATGLEANSYTGAELTKDAVGKYHRDIDLTVPGDWRWRWKGTGAVNAVSQGSFVVLADNT